MKKIIRKSLCWVLVCAMVLAQFLIPMPLQAQAASAVREADTNVQNGTTLHCWNWSYANILENLPTIAAQGFTSIQVSPIQKAKQPTMGGPVNDWWAFYQPAEFAIDNTGVNAMGTKAEFMNLCETAHEYGIYVIVDVVANHMAADYNYSRSPAILEDIRNDNSCWHNRNSNINNYSSRENITQYDLDSVLDLNTGSKKIQNYVLNYLKELIDAGADGFRFDAVKHIETPDDNASIASDFWPTVIYGAEEYAESKGLDLYCYGELLDHPDDVNGLPDSAYAKYYSVTDNVWGNNVRDAVVAGGNASSFTGTYHKNLSADQLVLWAESHDTYANRSSMGVSEANINKTWALVAARADAMSLYLSRTEGFTPPNMLGTAYLSGWNASEVAAVNKFHKAFVGQSEYVANSGSIAYVERGTSGAVLVNVGGNGTSVNVKANRLANGTYKDQISGNTFTVSGGKITGTIGSSGIAVIYNVASCSHASHGIAGLCTVCGASVSHSYSGGVCACGKTKPVTGTCAHSAHRYNGVCRGCGATVGHSYENGSCTVCGVEKPVDTFDYYLVGFINNSNVNEIKEEYRFKDGKLTLTSSTDAWISVRTYNGIFYQTSPDQQYNDTVTLRNASMSNNNSQMRVPGGKTVTLYLQSNYNGTYTLSYAEGGIVTPSGNASDYYLVGYINGANHGCEDDYANLGNYRFENGKLTATFNQDSYVFVKTGDNSKFLLADSYCTDTTCTFSEGKGEKMFVPGGVELTFTLTKNADGSVTVSYTQGGSTDPVDPTTKTVYVDITGFNWSKVNVYTWDAAGTAITGAWPGSAMTKVSDNIYSYEVPSKAVNIIFNDGTSQTNDLVIPTDGKNLYNYMQNSWSDYDTECSHSYTSKITLAASCTQNGLRTYTCSLCGLSYTEGIPATGHSWSAGRCTSCSTVCDHNWIDGICKTCSSACGHKWSNGTCLVCSLVCGHRNWIDGACVDCKLTCSHNYVSGFCQTCGLSDPDSQTPITYYLVGWINGANYGCEEDYENMGQYKFVNGKLTATFSQDSYVFLKSEGNGAWFLTESYCTDTTASFVIGGTEKMLVPGHVEVTFTLTENADGSLTLSYTKVSHTHSYEEIIDAATCEKAGVKTFVCAQCGDSYTESIPALGHQYSWQVVYDATCDGDGMKRYTCDRCSASYTEAIPATGHTMVNGQCVTCGSGSCTHNYTTEQIKAPTCTEAYVTRYTCTLCGYSYDYVGNPWGHNYVNGTCTMCGGADPNYVIPSETFYLVGWINGANYGCEEDYENMGQYRFVDGKLVATFTEESYVFLKTEGNAAWYLSMVYSPGPRCSFYNVADHAVSEKMLVPGGVEVTFYLSEGSNGAIELSYTTPNMVCKHESHNIDGICDSCGYQLTHYYVDGVCSCGAVEPVSKPVEYFLFGYINGANYACEEDAENMGQYKFVDGKLTATFTQDSYVGVKTTDNADWFMTNGYTGEYGVARLYNTNTLGNPDKLYVPGGVAVTFTLEVHWDNTLTLSYETGSAECTHSYTPKVTTAVSCTTEGVMTYVCSKCGDFYTESIPATGHDYVGGKCTFCGTLDESTTLTETYYLVGWINGADYGCESDYENNGSYKFVNGQLVAKFDQVSYVFVKTENNGKWLMAESYCTDTTCTFKEGGSEKMYVPGGVQLVFNITENADGSVVVTYTRDSSSTCTHSYTAEVTTAATCTTAGVRTYTCSKCSHSYTQSIPATGHNFFGSTCTVCGVADPNGGTTTSTNYYLVGYINGADYGCEGDYQNMGQYKFVNGRLTATFTQDSYIFVKTEGNGKWLLSSAYCEASTCTFAEGGSEKMFVPGGVQLTFTLAENTDGSVTVTYTSGSTPASEVPTLTLKVPTLEFKDMICINAFYTAENTQDVVEMGMITYTSKVSRWSVRSAEYVIPGATYVESSGRYYSSSQGIHAKYLADTFYLAVYAKLADGSYVYSKLAPYSPITYANSQLKNSTDVKMKQLVVAMLNYGAEAQLYFGHNTGNLANAALTAENLALPEAYRADMVSSVPAASATKQGSFANNSGFSKRTPAISFEGAFCINYFFTPKYAPSNGITLYYWNAADYNANTVLTTANATGSIKLEGSGTGEYRGDITGIAAKNLSEAIYVAAVYKNGSTTWTSGVLGYSIGAYCSSQASKGTAIADLAMATAVYGYHAKAYFG